MAGMLEKVTAFVVRPTPAGHDLLLFEHATAGIQIPAGTVEPGEAHRDAVLREAREETGLAGVVIQRYLGCVDTPLGAGHAAILATSPVYTRPSAVSATSAHLRRGLRVRQGRHLDSFALVTYAEWDSVEHPTYVAYQITGWVPEQILATSERRHFYLLAHPGATAERWTVVDETHRFGLFWAPLDALPIVQPQDDWLAMLPDTVRGTR